MVQKGLGLVDDFNEKWVASTRASWQIGQQVEDEGINLRQLLDHLFPPIDEGIIDVADDDVHDQPIAYGMEELHIV